ncbi:helix-turn-helix transcriptional regulator [Clostridium grantii]|uniref:Regulatory helix-turn-helix protein, AraC family n=1 Tax=Clostridium grantii DSM 8605 TaxID=1121316 RepID=A0A1M5SVI5_9CLOT|nr:helix-turn-helix transcriptional regulator [Clostridium grantii]SHH42499.1 regulatory helix-turn-helix protein, AraC family [Clostridium grantii DSM 8605]
MEELIPLHLMYEKINKFSDRHSIYILLSNLIFQASEKRQEDLDGMNTSVIECIKEYINENYDKNISLNDLVDIVFLSKKYLSTLVKKETGQTITDLITFEENSGC